MKEMKEIPNSFKTEEEYNQFLKRKMDELINLIKNDTKLLNVFKRLKDR